MIHVKDTDSGCNMGMVLFCGDAGDAFKPASYADVDAVVKQPQCGLVVPMPDTAAIPI